jgi:membrane protein involved in colicin uptake
MTMNEKLETLRNKLHGKLDSGINKLETVQNHLSSQMMEAEETVRSKLDEAKTASESLKQKLDDKKNRLKELAEEKKQEIEADIADCKAGRELKKLEKRAERAEEYAENCIEVAMCAIAEADEAVLEAVCARMDVIA